MHDNRIYNQVLELKSQRTTTPNPKSSKNPLVCAISEKPNGEGANHSAQHRDLPCSTLRPLTICYLPVSSQQATNDNLIFIYIPSVNLNVESRTGETIPATATISDLSQSHRTRNKPLCTPNSSVGFYTAARHTWKSGRQHQHSDSSLCEICNSATSQNRIASSQRAFRWPKASGYPFFSKPASICNSSTSWNAVHHEYSTFR